MPNTTTISPTLTVVKIDEFTAQFTDSSPRTASLDIRFELKQQAYYQQQLDITNTNIANLIASGVVLPK